jgi:hypothetical protein
MRSKAHIAPTAPLVLHHTRIGKYAMGKIGINGQWQKKHFLIDIHRFSLVIAALNVPRLCAKTVLPAYPSAQWCYQNAFVIVIVECKKYIQNVQRIFAAHI